MLFSLCPYVLSLHVLYNSLITFTLYGWFGGDCIIYDSLFERWNVCFFSFSKSGHGLHG